MKKLTGLMLVSGLACSNPQAPTLPPTPVNVTVQVSNVTTVVTGGPQVTPGAPSGSATPNSGTVAIDHVKVSAVGGGGTDNPHEVRVAATQRKFLTCTPFKAGGIPIQTVVEAGGFPSFFNISSGGTASVECTPDATNSYNLYCIARQPNGEVAITCTVAGKTSEPFALRSIP